MKRRLLITQLLFFLFAASLLAQNSMTDINRIKRDKSYLYGEATLDSKEAALKLAYELLELEIKNWATLKSTDISSVLAMGIKDFADTIILPRGNMVRAFAYVKTSNLKAVKGRNIAVKVDNAVPKEEPVVETPKEEPVKKVEVPKEEPVKEVETPKEEPVKEVEVPKEEPVKEVETPKEEPVAKPAPKVKTNEEEVLEKLLPIATFYDLEKTMKPLKEAGKIVDYGKYTTMSDPANCYLIIYDQKANIKAVLGKGTSSRQNMKTGAADSEKNYSGCGAIWFKVK